MSFTKKNKIPPTEVSEPKKSLLPKKNTEPLARPAITPQIIDVFFKEIFDNGIMRIDDTHYSVCFEYSDISFSKNKREEQEAILLKYVDFLNSHSETEHIQIVHAGTIVETEDYKSKFILPNNDNLSENEQRITTEINELITSVLGHKPQTLCETRLIVISIFAEDIDEAKDLFMEYQLRLEEAFKRFKSKIRRWTNQERLELLYNTININTFYNDYPDVNNIVKYAEANNLTVNDVLAPKQSVDFRDKSYIKIGDSKYVRIMYLDKLPNSITPKFYNELTTMQDANIIVTENITPSNPAKVINMIDKKISGMKTERLTKVKKAQKNHYDYSYVRDEALDSRIENANRLRDALTRKKQKLFTKNMLVCIEADNLKELNTVTNKVKKIASTHLVTLRNLDWQQLEGLKNLLPFGYNTLQFQRSLTSEACATSVPFNSKQLLHEKSIFYGMDLVSKNVVFADRKKLINGNGSVLATSGAGKSFFVKLNIEQIYTRYPDDDIIIIDPQGEYQPIINALNGQTIEISTLAKTYINPFDLAIDYTDDSSDPIKRKVEYILAFIESIVSGTGLTGEQKTIIDRCTKNILEDYVSGKGQAPDFPLFYEELKKFPEQEANNLALILERYVHGSMDIFAQHTNVEVHNRLISFDISNLTTSMQNTGYLVVLEYIMNKLSQNHQEGKNTWIWIDEFHILLANQFSAEYIAKIFRTGRKFGALPTIITQNITDVLRNDYGQKILANSEFAVILKQSPIDLALICKIFDISQEESNYVIDAPIGQGLLVYGEDKVAFKNTVPEDYYIYEINQTSNIQKSRT